jgi:Flp pilus assembly protein TadG
MRKCNLLLRRFRRNRSGVTAIEFALVITPFLMLLFGIFGVGLFYFAETTLDQAVTASIRQIRTGQSNSNNLTVGQLKQDICARTGGIIDCSKLSLNIQSSTSWTTFSTTASCVNSAGTVVASNHADTARVSAGAGGREASVVIVACYPWQLLATLPYIDLGNVNGGSARLIRSVTAFKSEPY